MPWSETTPMDQKMLFLVDCINDSIPISESCRRYGISRKTGYKWIKRYVEHGPEGIVDRSRRPHHVVRSTPPETVERILDARGHHPDWGAKKILWLLGRKFPEMALPPRSTICDILKRSGLVTSPRRRRKLGHPGRPTTPMTEPNDVWTADYKGQFKTGDGIYCYPLTIADGCSRFLFDVRGFLSPSHENTQPVFERLFREYGLPRFIRTDNGNPFATTAIGRLSQLSVWWVRLGIYPELIELGRPDQNGQHERMHRTLKAGTARPAAADNQAQQIRFDAFRQAYNHERPHEALGQQLPASLYKPSDRPFPNRLPQLEYPPHFEVRLVSENGGIRWRSKWVNVSHVLGGEYVGLEEIDNGIWEVHFGPVRLGRLDERDSKIEDDRGRKSRSDRSNV
ncbi:MAG TPA: IS481 family transposase [Candidatus Deferrimicrobiaceae bacterium]